ncbi:hypothetical protein, partial [Streptomyces sp. NPDC004599]
TTLRFWSDRGVDGFRVDVAHGLAKDLTEPLRVGARGSGWREQATEGRRHKGFSVPRRAGR